MMINTIFQRIPTPSNLQLRDEETLPIPYNSWTFSKRTNIWCRCPYGIPGRSKMFFLSERKNGGCFRDYGIRHVYGINLTRNRSSVMQNSHYVDWNKALLTTAVVSKTLLYYLATKNLQCQYSYGADHRSWHCYSNRQCLRDRGAAIVREREYSALQWKSKQPNQFVELQIFEFGVLFGSFATWILTDFVTTERFHGPLEVPATPSNFVN